MKFFEWRGVTQAPEPLADEALERLEFMRPEGVADDFRLALESGRAVLAELSRRPHSPDEELIFEHRIAQSPELERLAREALASGKVSRETALRFLFEEMLEDERAAFEDRIFHESDTFLALLELEEDLVQAYLRGTLDEGEKLRFETGYLTHPARERRISVLRASVPEQSTSPTLRYATLAGVALLLAGLYTFWVSYKTGPLMSGHGAESHSAGPGFAITLAPGILSTPA
ncbi:MAG TPA: hypothetical protein VE621_21280, partial [Bryobacteraceae bacterium]|nr:hypothetical protein [Bryobacteraceae bacterium]